jgi:hypothetical protein
VRPEGPNVPLEFLDPSQGSTFQRRCVAGDIRLARSFHARDAAFERGDQLEELTNGMGRRYRHERPSREPVS